MDYTPYRGKVLQIPDFRGVILLLTADNHVGIVYIFVG